VRKTFVDCSKYQIQKASRLFKYLEKQKTYGIATSEENSCLNLEGP